MLPAPSLQARKAVISSLKPGFDYLEPNRLTGNCQRPHDCSHEYAVFKAVRVFDPAFARETKVDANAVESLAIIRCLTRDLIDGMKLELDKYATAVADVSISRADVQEFTDDVLTFWRTHKSELPMWARSAHRFCYEHQLRRRLVSASSRCLPTCLATTRTRPGAGRSTAGFAHAALQQA